MTTIRNFHISFPLAYELCANLFNGQDYFNDRRGYRRRETPYSSELGNKRKQLGRAAPAWKFDLGAQRATLDACWREQIRENDCGVRANRETWGGRGPPRLSDRVRASPRKRVCYRRRDAIRSIQATRLGSKPGHQPLCLPPITLLRHNLNGGVGGGGGRREEPPSISLEFAHRRTSATTSSTSTSSSPSPSRENLDPEYDFSRKLLALAIDGAATRFFARGWLVRRETSGEVRFCRLSDN